MEETEIREGYHFWTKGKDISFNLPLALDPIERKRKQSYFSTAELSCKCQSKQCGEQRVSVELVNAMISLREAYDEPLKVSSGLRCLADHKRIYAQKGITDESKIPMQSQHLVTNGRAVDFSDKDGKLKEWAKNNTELLEALNIYCEHWTATENWWHIQCWKPKSGNHWFKP